MEYLRFLLVMILDVLASAGLSYGLFKYLTNGMGNSTGDLGVGVAAVVVSIIAFVFLVVLVGFVLYSLIM